MAKVKKENDVLVIEVDLKEVDFSDLIPSSTGKTYGICSIPINQAIVVNGYSLPLKGNTHLYVPATNYNDYKEHIRVKAESINVNKAVDNEISNQVGRINRLEEKLDMLLEALTGPDIREIK